MNKLAISTTILGAFLCLLHVQHVCAQEWTSWVTIYPQVSGLHDKKVQISFKYGNCKATSSYYRLRSDFTSPKCHLNGKFYYNTCEGKVSTTNINLSLETPFEDKGSGVYFGGISYINAVVQFNDYTPKTKITKSVPSNEPDELFFPGNEEEEKKKEADLKRKKETEELARKQAQERRQEQLIVQKANDERKAKEDYEKQQRFKENEATYKENQQKRDAADKKIEDQITQGAKDIETQIKKQQEADEERNRAANERLAERESEERNQRLEAKKKEKESKKRFEAGISGIYRDLIIAEIAKLEKEEDSIPKVFSRSGWKYFKLKGKVKSLTSRYYHNGELSSTTVINFSESGVIISEENNVMKNTYKIGTNGLIETVQTVSKYDVFVQNFRYDKRGRIALQWDSQVTLFKDYTYNESNRVISNKHFAKDGTVFDCSYEYNEHKDIVKTYFNSSNSVMESNSSYTYDSNGNWIELETISTRNGTVGLTTKMERELEYY